MNKLVVAQRKYDDHRERKKRVKKKQLNGSNKRKGSRQVVYKLQIILSLLIVGALCIGILLGYVKQAELKYRMNVLSKEVNQLEANIENLKVEIETTQRSDIIEQKAKERLGMQYPNKEQMVFLNIEKTDRVGISQQLEIEKMKQNEETNKHLFIDNMKAIIYALYNILD